ncbi:MAG: hypothetical protein WD066_20050 [Planctomycetaceae bacterium]
MRRHVRQIAILAALVALSLGCAERKPSPLGTGGVRLKYEVGEWGGPGSAPDRLEICRAIEARLDDPNLPPVLARFAGDEDIEVLIGGERAIEGNPTLETIKSRLDQTGTISFQILANEIDHPEIIKQARASDGREVRDETRVVARWVEASVDADGNPKINGGDETITRPVEENGKPKTGPNGDEIREFLVIEEPEEEQVTGRYLVRAVATTDENGQPAVNFTLNDLGGALFQVLTSRNRPRADGSTRQLGIILDGKLHSAPRLQAVIGVQGQITGRFTQQEVDDLAASLVGGGLPRLKLVEAAPFEPLLDETRQD